MSLKQIHHSLISGWFTVIVFILLVFIMRLLSQPDWNDPAFWAAFLLQVTISLALLQVNHTFTIIRSQTILPALFYLLMTGGTPLFYTAWQGSIAAFGVLICLIYLFGSYQKPASQLNALNIGLILTFCSFVWPPVLLLFPFIWYCFYAFRSLNFRTFFATIIGIMTVYLFVFAWNIYHGGIRNFFEMLPQWQEFLVIHPFSLDSLDILVFVLLAVLFVISGFDIFVSGLSEKIRARTYLKYLYLTTICITVVMNLQSEWKANWTLILCLPV
ncbi:MAG: DUF6427 family protein, partial [Dysgonamonadaceae bacterium]|nr:DUF6427 family protein [Dysgonamonadaceae bacterium]